ncbi:MAG: uroporphyrinogen decarboxylase [Calditrichaeota bacterium]|nr:uroporphyrinogen decarboxylase [Calditrichota bacterium]MCB9369838.1 uroporphyrinogen decarboxylase [Calditrichota bacterium]
MLDTLVQTHHKPTFEIETKKFLRAARGEVLDVPPVWLMRQAGRYLPEYLAVRADNDFVKVCLTPELACEVTMQPIRRFGFDAAILFSDILIPAIPFGNGLHFDKGHGPVIDRPVRERRDVENMRNFDPREELTEVLNAVKMIRSELADDKALIGFAGAPFTLACYMIEGGKPDPFRRTKNMIYADPKTFELLLDNIAAMTVDYMRAMIEYGADAIQLFDTWGGILTDEEYRRVNLPVLQRIFSALRELDVPLTYFVLNGMHLESASNVGASVYGLDWRMNFSTARKRFGHDVALQGNLDPVLLLTDEQTIRRRTREILVEAGQRGHIFNLGHGILPDTPIQNVEILLDEIRGGKK